MRLYLLVLQATALLCVPVYLAACNPATVGWSSSQGKNISARRLANAKAMCGYVGARKKAMNLLGASGNKQRNEQHAARLMNDAERCMAKYNVHHQSGSALGIGQFKISLK